RGCPPAEFPGRTMIGAMLHYLASADPRNFSPVNAMIGILPDLPEDALDVKTLKKSGNKNLKAAKRHALREIALTEIAPFAM
ncbi:MAG: hypothetical protein LBH03_07530, partial [Holophagales bacterium]|nr:hypothetical protein [Holophagales bacterium]